MNLKSLECKVLLLINEVNTNKRFFEWLRSSVEIYNATSVQDALLRLSKAKYHLVIIKWIKSFEFECQVIQTIRKLNNVPILVIFQKKDNFKWRYIEAGADIAVPEPIHYNEITMCIFSLIRRYVFWTKEANFRKSTLQEGFLKIDFLSRKIFWCNKEFSITSREFDFLHLLVMAPGRVYTFEQIYETVWHEHPLGNINNILWCFTHRLRKKLKAQDPRAEEIIKCVRNVGYYFEAIEDIP